MELRHLRYFLALVEELHFGRAAKRMHVSQPPFSRQIRQLEEELGAQLFGRTKRTVALTAVGRAYAQEVRLILQQLDRAGELALEADEEKCSELVVGYSPRTVHISVGILKAFSERFPHIQILVKNLETLWQIEALNNGRIDVGLVTLRLPVDSEALETEIILRDRLVIAMPKHHPLSSRKLIPLRALASETMIIVPLRRNEGNYGLIAEMCRRAGLSLHRFHEVDSIHHTLEIIGAGLGVSLMRASVERMAHKGVVFRELQHSPILETAVARKRSNRSPLVLSFIEIAREELS